MTQSFATAEAMFAEINQRCLDLLSTAQRSLVVPKGHRLHTGAGSFVPKTCLLLDGNVSLYLDRDGNLEPGLDKFNPNNPPAWRSELRFFHPHCRIEGRKHFVFQSYEGQRPERAKAMLFASWGPNPRYVGAEDVGTRYVYQQPEQSIEAFMDQCITVWNEVLKLRTVAEAA